MARRGGVMWRVLVSAQILMVSGAATECTSWRVQQVAPARVIEKQHPEKVRVSRASGGKVVLDNPLVVGDSIVGRQGAVAVADVTAVEVRKFDGLKTVGVIGGVIVVGTLACAAAGCFDFDLGPIDLGE